MQSTCVHHGEYSEPCIDDSKYVAGVFVGLKKAIDTVDHDIPIKNPDHYGARCIVKASSYLKGRKEFLVIEYETSATKET